MMSKRLKLYLIAAPSDFYDASRTGFFCACLFYRMGKGPVLLRSSGLSSHRGGVLALSDKGFEPGGEEYAAFSRELASEAVRRGFTSVLLDIENPALFPLVSAVCPVLTSYKLPVFLSPRLSGASKDAFVLIPSAISGGSFEGMLRDASEKYGSGRLALELVRQSSDFSLPFSDSDGTPLSPSERDALMERCSASSFFSRELCAKYFTYCDEAGTPHFVLYDDASTLSAKLTIAESFGITHAFSLYPDAKDLLSELSGYK